MLQRRFDGWSANQAWVSDITFIATAEGWLYLAAILDFASRRIAGWSMSDCGAAFSAPSHPAAATTAAKMPNP